VLSTFTTKCHSVYSAWDKTKSHFDVCGLKKSMFTELYNTFKKKKIGMREACLYYLQYKLSSYGENVELYSFLLHTKNGTLCVSEEKRFKVPCQPRYFRHVGSCLETMLMLKQ
jgi:hypothetical protein